MKSFFSNMSLARLIIILSIPGSIYLGWAGNQQREALEELRPSFGKVAIMLREVQEMAKLNSKLERDIKGDQYLGKDSLASYVLYCADHRSVSIGAVKTTPNRPSAAGGVLDKQMTIRPADPKRAFTHAQIAAFLYRLEADSNQVKVTSVQYRLLGKGVKNDDIPADEWTFDITVTNRVKAAAKARR
jgi:hypothetical protein